MKVGDLVDYYGKYLAVVMDINDEGGVIKAHLTNGDIKWLVKSGCKVVSS